MKTDAKRRFHVKPRVISAFFIALLLCAGSLSAEPELSAKTHFLAAANNRNEAAEIRMECARKLRSNARDLLTLPAKETNLHQANIYAAANLALSSAKHAAKAVVNYDKTVSILLNMPNDTLQEYRSPTLDQKDYRDKAEEAKEKAVISAIFVAEAYEWAAEIYIQNNLSQDKQASALEQAAGWRENIASRILQK